MSKKKTWRTSVQLLKASQSCDGESWNLESSVTPNVCYLISRCVQNVCTGRASPAAETTSIKCCSARLFLHYAFRRRTPVFPDHCRPKWSEEKPHEAPRELSRGAPVTSWHARESAPSFSGVPVRTAALETANGRAAASIQNKSVVALGMRAELTAARARTPPRSTRQTKRLREANKASPKAGGRPGVRGRMSLLAAALSLLRASFAVRRWAELSRAVPTWGGLSHCCWPFLSHPHPNGSGGRSLWVAGGKLKDKIYNIYDFFFFFFFKRKTGKKE